MNIDDLLLLSVANSLAIVANQTPNRKRKWCIHPDNRRRMADGEFEIHFLKKKKHADKFFHYLRMSPDNFDLLLSILTPFFPIPKQTGRKRLSNEQRLAVTLRYLATGQSMASLSQTWLIGESTMRKIINETLDCLWVALTPKYIPTPDAELWRKKATEFEQRWNLPFCVGALDGKHIVMDAPAKSGSLYYNYKVKC